METKHRTYMYHLPLPTREPVYVRYPLEDGDEGALYAAHHQYHEILSLPRKPLTKEIQEEIMRKVPGVLSQTLSP
jgi:hypothetical protein